MNEDQTYWDTVVTFAEAPPKSEQKIVSRDCKSGDRYFTNGATWHPVIGPFGEMDCVLCKCHFGKIECARLECENKKNFPCKKPIKVTGQCCPVCQDQKPKISLGKKRIYFINKPFYFFCKYKLLTTSL